MRTAILTSILLCVLSGTVLAQSIGGAYRVSGTNFNGSRYSGTAQITFSTSGNCNISWVTGSTTSYGSCIRNGAVFAAGYILSGAVGIVLYQLRSDGSLVGTWTLANHSGTGTETLTPMR